MGRPKEGHTYMYSVPGGALCRQYSGNKLLSSPRQTRIYRWPSRTGLVYGSVPRYSLRSHPRKFTCPSISFAVITKASASRKLLACAHAAGSMTAGGVTNGACTIYMPRVRFLPPPPPPPFATDLLQRLPGVDVRLEDCLGDADRWQPRLPARLPQDQRLPKKILANPALGRHTVPKVTRYHGDDQASTC